MGLLSRAVCCSHGAHIGRDTAVALQIGTCGAHSRGEAALECLLASRRRSALRSFGKRRGQLCLWGWGRWTLRRRRGYWLPQAQNLRLGTKSFHSHWLPLAQNLEPKAIAGSRRRRVRWGETEMSQGAGSYDIFGRWLIPRQTPRSKALKAKRGGSAQPRAQSTRSVFLMVQISIDFLD